MFDDDGNRISGGTTANGNPVIQPLNPTNLFSGDTGTGIEMQPAGFFIYKEVKKSLTIEVFHHFAAKRIYNLLRIVAFKKLIGCFRQKSKSLGVAPNVFFSHRALGDFFIQFIARSGNRL